MKLNTIATLTLVTLSLAACMERTAPPAPVVNLGADIDSATGAVMVSRNDTLYDISERYGLSMRDIIEVNGIAPPYTINTGQRLKLPAPREYRVEQGDSLYRLSRMFGMSMTDLARQNNLSAPYTLQAGQNLKVSRNSTPAVVQTASYTIQPKVETPKALQTMPSSRPAKVEQAVIKPPVKSSTIGKPVDKGFVWPVKGQVLSSYGPKENGLHNDGVNIAAPRGSAVGAASAGQVMYVGNALKGFGNLVLVRHDNGWITAYSHLDTIKVARGQNVSQGDAIGTVGSTGRVDTPQLHFEVRRGSQALNPQKYLPAI